MVAFFFPPPPFVKTVTTTTTWDPSNNYLTLSNGNKTAAYSSGSNPAVRSTTSRSSGKYVFAILFGASGTVANGGFGIGTASSVLSNNTNDANTYGNYGGAVYSGGAQVGSSGTNANSTWGFVAIDVGNKLLWFSNDGTTWGTTIATSGGNPATGSGGITISPSGPYYIITGMISGAATQTLDTVGTGGSGYSPPSGFSWWG